MKTIIVVFSMIYLGALNLAQADPLLPNSDPSMVIPNTEDYYNKGAIRVKGLYQHCLHVKSTDGKCSRRFSEYYHSNTWCVSSFIHRL